LRRIAPFDKINVERGRPVNIHELTALTGETARQVRYLIAEGLMPPPAGGRANADYGDAHVAAIRAFQRLRALGFRPAAIRLLREGRGAPVSIPLAPGLAISLDPALLAGGAGPRPDRRALAARIDDILDDILTETSHHAPAKRADTGE
jgi:MerR family transcriptional regulator, copper efflux regulator